MALRRLNFNSPQPNPDKTQQSGDTGGILRDWSTPRFRRLALLHWVQPHPSRLFFDGAKYVFKPGAYAKPECNPRWRQRQPEPVHVPEPAPEPAPAPTPVPTPAPEAAEPMEPEAEPEQRKRGRIRGWAVEDY